MVNPDRNLYEPPFDDALLYESDLEPERPRSRPLVVLLGMVVLAAFAGVVWVAYNQGVKQGQNGVPTLTADSQPDRIPGAETAGVAPEKDYGRLQGMSAEPGAVNLLPEPEKPLEVPAEEPPAEESYDGPTALGGPRTLKATDFTPPAASASPQSIVKAPPSAPSPAASEDITSALPPPETAVPAPSKPATPPLSSTKLALAPTKPAAPPAPAPTPAVEESAVTDLATPEVVPVPAPASSGGSVMIQLGSFPNSGLAASAWSKIKSSNQELLGSYSPTIKPAEIEGKGTWYRLRVGGFADKAAARGVCDQLTANGQACIVAGK